MLERSLPVTGCAVSLGLPRGAAPWHWGAEHIESRRRGTNEISHFSRGDERGGGERLRALLQKRVVLCVEMQTEKR